MLNLYRHLLARHGGFVIACALLLAGFHYLMCGLVSTLDVTGILEQVKKSAPPFLQSALGEQFLGDLSSRGLLAFAWTHPISLALGAAVAIVLAARGIAGEIESGTLELVLSQPLSRYAYLIGQWGFAASALLTVSLSGICGTLAGQYAYRLHMFDPGLLVTLAINFFLLQCVWFGLSSLLSVFGREGGRVTGIAFLLALLSYTISVLGRLLPKAAFLLPISMFHYYSPQALLIESAPAAPNLAILGAATALCLAAVAWRFVHRDIP